MKIRTKVKAGGFSSINHNQCRKLVIRTGIKSGSRPSTNHNQRLTR